MCVCVLGSPLQITPASPVKQISFSETGHCSSEFSIPRQLRLAVGRGKPLPEPRGELLPEPRVSRTLGAPNNFRHNQQ